MNKKHVIDFAKKIRPIIHSQYNYKNWEKQYKNFLSMCKKNPHKVIIPNMIEDFMWHAHMLNHNDYNTDCINIFGSLLDHNDTIDGKLMEMIELSKDKHPFFVATQSHPEFLSRPTISHPLFDGLIKAMMK